MISQNFSGEYFRRRLTKGSRTKACDFSKIGFSSFTLFHRDLNKFLNLLEPQMSSGKMEERFVPPRIFMRINKVW